MEGDLPKMVPVKRRPCPRCGRTPASDCVSFNCPDCGRGFCGECQVPDYAQGDGSFAYCPHCGARLKFPPTPVRRYVQEFLENLGDLRPGTLPKDRQLVESLLRRCGFRP